MIVPPNNVKFDAFTFTDKEMKRIISRNRHWALNLGHRQNGLQTSESQKSEIQVSEGHHPLKSVGPESFLASSQFCWYTSNLLCSLACSCFILTLSSHGCLPCVLVCLGVQIPIFLQGHQSYWVRSSQRPHTSLITSVKTQFPNEATF